jgi:hypothetical protein
MEVNTMYTIWLYVDPFASMDGSPEEEYDDIERELNERLPGECVFHRNKLPHELKTGSPDVYLFDIGGMCVTDYSGTLRDNFCHTIVEQVDEKTNTLFVPYTMMTRSSFRFALSEYLPEFAVLPEEERGEHVLEEGKRLRPNLWYCDKEHEWDVSIDEQMYGEIVKWLHQQ